MRGTTRISRRWLFGRGAGVLLGSALIGSMGVTAAAAVDGVDEVERIVADAAPSDSSVADGHVVGDELVASIDAAETATIPLDRSEPVVIATGRDAGTPLVVDPLPGVELAEGEVLDGGSVYFEDVDGEAGFGLVVQPLSDEGTRFTVVIHDPASPTEFRFRAAPDGGRIELVEQGALVFDADGEFIAGVMPPWATDVDGDVVETSFLVDGEYLVQDVLHGSGVEYPVVADPLFRRGMIKRVNKESWNSSRGGYEVQVEVTALARWTWFAGRSDIVAIEGIRDLQEHYPRSMKKATMVQQWDCHVAGLPATFKLDLEGWRSSKPNWRRTEIMAGVREAIKHRDPRRIARACNW